MTPPFPLILLLITLPLVFPSQCNPSICPSKCCSDQFTCASNPSECNSCDPEACQTGCCIDGRCAANASDCVKTGNLTLIICLGVSFAAIVPITFFIYKYAAYLSKRSAEDQVEAPEKQRAKDGVVVLPVVEVEVLENQETDAEIEGEERVQGEEIDNSVFMKRLQEGRQAQEEYREAAYEYYGGQGGDPRKKKEEEEPEIVLVYAV